MKIKKANVKLSTSRNRPLPRRSDGLQDPPIMISRHQGSQPTQCPYGMTHCRKWRSNFPRCHKQQQLTRRLFPASIWRQTTHRPSVLWYPYSSALHWSARARPTFHLYRSAVDGRHRTPTEICHCRNLEVQRRTRDGRPRLPLSNWSRNMQNYSANWPVFETPAKQPATNNSSERMRGRWLSSHLTTHMI